MKTAKLLLLSLATGIDFTGPVSAQCTLPCLGRELIVNGDFSMGNIGFSSDYSFVTSSCNPGEYAVDTNANLYVGCWTPNGDHTDGHGKFFLCNGSTIAPSNAWDTTLAVNPHTNYVFSVWVINLIATNPNFCGTGAISQPNLELNINGKTISGVAFSVPQNATWMNICGVWNSGNTLSATLAVADIDNDGEGNDFGVDDISFRASTTVNLAVSPNSTICLGASTTLSVSGSANYTWFPSATLNSFTGASVSADPTLTTTYTVTEAVCDSSISTTLYVSVLPVITLSPNASLCIGTSTYLSAEGADSYLWTPSAGLNTTIGAIVLYKSLTEGMYTYTVTGTNSNSCSGSSSVTINIEQCDVLYIPTAFTPNGDGKNDSFFMEGIFITDFLLQVFNRWGELVFQSNDVNRGWDGKYKNELAQEGVYVYSVKGRWADETSFNKMGMVTLIR